jgi:hypothetical protein
MDASSGEITRGAGMTVEEKVLEKLRRLPPEKQKAVLDFVGLLLADNEPKAAMKSLEGLWEEYDIHITEEDIAEMRREMWGKFPTHTPSHR